MDDIYHVWKLTGLKNAQTAVIHSKERVRESCEENCFHGKIRYMGDRTKKGKADWKFTNAAFNAVRSQCRKTTQSAKWVCCAALLRKENRWLKISRPWSENCLRNIEGHVEELIFSCPSFMEALTNFFLLFYSQLMKTRFLNPIEPLFFLFQKDFLSFAPLAFRICSLA